ncbi:hypothetical protein F2Q68_00022494 [Brassica cretica]|uniref:Uncharacterized protein n=1 Tax=Brassica cretica TaxID=69181 RepID=A0A8S9FZI5_BRACR|nr:hypothetical protein F2Q68_00022494 [Brassica cretica]
MEITERRHDEIMDNVKSQYVSDERHSRELKGSSTEPRLVKIRILKSTSVLLKFRLKGFGPATVTLLVLLYCLVQVISISSSCLMHMTVMGLRDSSIKRHLKLPHAYVMEYKPHDASLHDNSSYRNTWLRG